MIGLSTVVESPKQSNGNAKTKNSKAVQSDDVIYNIKKAGI
jgi:hypothetical protein